MAKAQAVTPFGTAIYPRLNTPDTKYDDNGVYKVDLLLQAGKETDAFVGRLEDLFQEQAVDRFGSKFKRSPHWPIKAEEDDEGNETGNTIIRCKVAAIVNAPGKQPWDRKPVLMDSKKNPVDVNVGGGSVIRIALEVYVWQASGKVGMTLQPLKVQIKELVEWTGGDQTDAMLDAIDDGFEAEDAELETAADADF